MIDLYLAHLTLAGCRPATVKARRLVLTAFAASLPPATDLSTAARGHVELWLSRPLAPASRRAYAAHISSFYRWAVREDYLTLDPTVRLPAFRVPRGIPRPVSDDDLRDALAAAPQRMRAWLLLMAMAGLRAMEVSALRPVDLSVADDGQASLWLRECKGGGTGSVPAHPVVVTALLCLPVRSGVWWSCGPSIVSRDVSAHLHGLGIEASGHQLRHRSGTEFYRASGHDLLATARLLRHASVATTQVYARIDPERPQEVVSLMRAV